LKTYKDKTTRGQRQPNPLSITLTLTGCKAVKKGITGTSDNFKYEIFSPAATTEPLNGGAQQETLVGTFTQLPVSFLLRLTRQETPFSFASFYGDPTKTRKPYFNDYLSCLKNVKDRFGSESDPYGSQIDNFRPVESSKLRQFGKNPQCKIVLVKGNVGAEVQKEDNDGSVFVGASQLNGAEYPFPEPVTDLNEYKYDSTGGPLLQLSCHPVVAKFILDHAERTGFTSSPFLVINAVDGVLPKCSRNFNVKLNNGYLEVSEKLKDGKELELNVGENPSPNATAIFDSFCDNLKVLQTDDVPTSGLTPPTPPNIYTEFNSNSTSKVSLIYASAVPLSYSLRGSNVNPEKSMLQYCVAGFDLVAQYFGAMVSAYNKSINQKQQSQTKVKLFLTPLGGGVFKNPREMIASSVLLAYYQAQQLFADFDDKVKVIFLVWDGSPDECSDFSEFFNSSDVEKAEGVGSSFLPPKTPKISRVASDDTGEAAGAALGENTQETSGIASDDTAAEAKASAAAAGEAAGAASEEAGATTEEAPPAAMTGDELYEKYKSQKDFGKHDLTMSDYLKQDDINAFRSSLVTDTTKLEELKTELQKINKPKADDTLLGVPKPYWFETEDGKKCEELLKEVFSQLGMTYTEYNLENSSLYIDNAKKLKFLKTIFFLYTSGENPTCDTYVKECVSLYNVILEAASLVAYISLNASINSMVIQKSGNFSGGSKSRRRKRMRKTHRGHTRKYKSKSKSKPKTHRHRRHSRVRKHKKYTSRRR
jgi:hypothetical protein